MIRNQNKIMVLILKSKSCPSLSTAPLSRQTVYYPILDYISKNEEKIIIAFKG